MPAYKNKESGSWYVVTQYTDWTGERKQKCKRGFKTRREALEWEQKFQQQSAGDQPQRGHDRAAGYAGGADGENAQQQAEQHHGTQRGHGAV